ncbi:DUF4382 domain-containing protein [Muriicola soli]|uniref:DUF4382 domain-containing protein n=1 Tax=Muriicola soli TaxID=2507538 RepID=A0A411E944_9FLAO|nr:DUF4382 domain-containing protein [Muriicola soli]QBA64158.1 DUF4382 domain-containing protein [Muriicola soli]
MKTRYLWIWVCSLFVLIGCSESESTTEETGRLTIQLTDAPFPHDMIAEANVTVFKIEARQKGEDEDEGNHGEDGMIDEDSGNDYIVLMEEEITVNLLDLTNGVTENLVDTEIPAGEYDLFRVYVKGVNLVLNDEEMTTYDLKVPSGEQSGIKIFVDPPLVVAGGLSADVLFDFDVSRSFVARGNIKRPESFNGFIFKPVIKVSNLTTAGTIQGMVTSLVEAESVPLEGVQISVLREGEVVTSSFTDETGGYMILGLDSGDYEMMAELEGYISESVEMVSVVPGNTISVDFELELTE